jgi:hypothetical protein
MIRINRSHAAALLLAGALAACSDAPTGAANDSEATLARQVAALGFRTDMIEDHGDYVLVEGDIYLSKQQLRTVALVDGDDPLRPGFQYRTTSLVGSPKVHTITVDLSGLNSQTAWKSAAQTALTHWSGISNSYVKLVEGTPADITVSTACVASNVAAYASWPSAGNPGSTIHVNTCFGYSTSTAQKVHNMVHEFGHTLGFRHSNYTQQGESAGTEGAVHISGTPTSGNASGSVMNGGTALNSWAGFASSDLTATRSLYPLPAPTNATYSYPNGTVVYSWDSMPGASYYQIRGMELYWEANYYENWRWEHLTEGAWQTVYGTSWDSGNTYTGKDRCTWSQSNYDETASDYWVELKAVYANGTSSVAYLPAYYGPC